MVDKISQQGLRLSITHLQSLNHLNIFLPPLSFLMLKHRQCKFLKQTQHHHIQEFISQTTLPTTASSIDMPSFSYNPRQYQLTVTYTNYQDVQTRATILFDYDTNEISFVDATGSAISNEDIFLFASYNERGNIDLYFNDIGFYDITFDFVYNFTSSLADGQNQVSHLISLDLPNIDSQSPYNTNLNALHFMAIKFSTLTFQTSIKQLEAQLKKNSKQFKAIQSLNRQISQAE